MKRPSKIKVLGQEVTIKVLAKPEQDDGTVCHGMCEVNDRRISIEAGLNNSVYSRVLRHEVFHMKMGLSGLSEMLTDEQEEALAIIAEID